MIIYIDLDRTLFNTDKFKVSAWQWIEVNYKNIDAELETERLGKFMKHTGDMHMYDFFAHVSEVLKLDNEAMSSLKNNLRSSMRETDLLLAGAAQALTILKELGDCHILSFGEEHYQIFKARCVPALDNLPVTIVQEPKGDYLRRAGVDERCLLIDDKLVHNELADNVDFVHIDTKLNSEFEKSEVYVSAQNLYHAAKYLQSLDPSRRL